MKLVVKVIFDDIQPGQAPAIVRELQAVALNHAPHEVLVYQDSGGCLDLAMQVIVDKAYTQLRLIEEEDIDEDVTFTAISAGVDPP